MQVAGSALSGGFTLTAYLSDSSVAPRFGNNLDADSQCAGAGILDYEDVLCGAARLALDPVCCRANGGDTGHQLPPESLL